MRYPIALDVSNVNPATLDEVRESGCSLLICKATEGDSYHDATLVAHRGIARELGIRFGSYVFLHVGSVGNEAQAYLDYARPERDELAIIDAEAGAEDGRSVDGLAHRTWSCAHALEHAGKRPLIYASSSTWKEMLRAVPHLRRYRVWEAEYPGRFSRWFPKLARMRVRLRHGVTVVMWQFTDSYAVRSKRFDASRILVKLRDL